MTVHPIRRWMLLVIVVVFAVYSPSFGNGFTLDDNGMVRVPSIEPVAPNHMVRDIQPLGDYLTSSYAEGVGGRGRGFRPFTKLSFAIVHHLTEDPSAPAEGPLAPAGPQHVVNVVLHCAATWLCFEMLVLLFGLGWPALIGGAIFGLHALRSDPVISMVGRGEILAFLFGAGGLLLYLGAMTSSGLRRAALCAATALSLFVAFGSKESAVAWAVMLPLFAQALRWSGQDQASRIPALRQQLPVYLVAVLLPLAVFLVLLFRIWSTAEPFEPFYMHNPLWYQDAASRIASGVVILAYGLGKCILPWTLSCDYSHAVFDIAEGFGDLRFLGSFLLLGGLLAFGLSRARREPAWLVAVAFFFGFSFLTSNIPMAVETVFGERLYYTPAVFLSFVVAWSFGKFDPKYRRLMVVGLLLWLAFCSVRIVQRDFAWKDTGTLFDTDVWTVPRSMLLQSALSVRYRGGDPKLWEEAIDRVMAIDPTDPAPNIERAMFLRRTGDEAGAEQLLRQVATSNHPDMKRYKALVHSSLGGLLEDSRRIPEARAEFEAGAAAVGFTDPQTQFELARFYLRNGLRAEASAQLGELTRECPDDLNAWMLRLRLLQEDGDEQQFARAVADARRAVGDDPWFGVLEALLLEQRGDSVAALKILDANVPRLPLTPRTASAWLSYARSLIAAGRIQEARKIIDACSRGPFAPQTKREFQELRAKLR